MGLFGKKKKEATENSSSCTCGNCAPATASEAAQAESSGSAVKVLGSGCAKCNELEASVVEALGELGMDSTVEHVTDFAQIAAYGVMTTPALVVDGKVVSYGKVLKKEEVVKLLQKVRG